MAVELRDDEGIKKIEAALLLVAIMLLPLGVVSLQDAMDSGDTTKYLMSMGLIIVGAVCGILYLYVEKATPKSKEEEEEVDEDADAAEEETKVKKVAKKVEEKKSKKEEEE